MRFNPRDISYLAHGTERQREAHRCLLELSIFEKLSQYRPALVSTVCLNIDTPSSDLDIICEVYDCAAFENDVARFFGSYDRFLTRRSVTEAAAVVAQFFTPMFEIELYGEPTPIEQQNGYRHFMQFERVLRLGGEDVRARLQALKTGGMKSEPALAYLLGLTGDPYRAVLNLERVSDDELASRISSSRVR